MKRDELNAYKADVTIPVYGTIADAEVYLKSEVDKVIAEKDAEIARLKEQIEVLKHQACTMNCMIVKHYNEVCDDNVYHKYKRLLDEAKICQLRLERYEQYLAGYIHASGPTVNRCKFLISHYEKWLKRWLELAEKYKPNT